MHSRDLCARVHDDQARRETALVLTPWKYPSLYTVLSQDRTVRADVPPLGRAYVHRAVLGAEYSSPSDQPPLNPTH